MFNLILKKNQLKSGQGERRAKKKKKLEKIV